MKNHHEVGHFKNRLMILLLALIALLMMAGQSFATDCSTCHGMPPLDSSDGKRHPEAGAQSGAFVGNHQTHAGADAASCVKCHSNAATYDNKHAATSLYKISMSENINNSTPAATYSKGTFFNQTSVPITGGTCSNVNCHADPRSSGSVTTPAWGTTGTGCSACHTGLNAITENGPATGSHTNTPGHAVACTECHETGTSATTKPGSGHLDTNIDVVNVGYPPNKEKGTAGASCSTASCHADPYVVDGHVATPNWGSADNGCAACHTGAKVITSSGPATGAHAAHAGKACTICHAAGTTATTAPSKINGHIDGNVDVYYFNYPADVTKHASSSYPGTCSTAWCHSNGKGAYVSPRWDGSKTGCTFCHPTLSPGHTIHVDNLLSSISFYNYTANNSVGSTYKFGCANCHPLLVENHLNNSVEVVLTASVSGGHLKAKNGAGATITGSKCSNVYCHSNGYIPGATYTYAETPVWGGNFALADRCANCHGNSPNEVIAGSSAHTAHVVGIHVDDVFNGVSKKLPIGGAAPVNAAHGRNNRSTTINCNICHNATVTSSANDKNSFCAGCHDGTTPPGGNQNTANPLTTNAANHVNGKVDVNFIDQRIATKAQLADKAFAGYTASNAGGWTRNSNGMNFKTYTSSYDVTKFTLFATAGTYSQAAGCLNVACHNGKTVKWADTVSCTSCHTRLK